MIEVRSLELEVWSYEVYTEWTTPNSELLTPNFYCMNLSIKTKQITLTDPIRAYIEEKLATLDAKVARFGTSVTSEVEVGMTSKHHKKGPIFRAEIHIRLPGKLVYAEAEDLNLYMAIGEAKKEAERQVLGYKGSKDAKMKRGGREARRRG